jgi:3-dehydroquinate synthase
MEHAISASFLLSFFHFFCQIYSTCEADTKVYIKPNTISQTMHQTIQVRLPSQQDRSYTIAIARGALDSLPLLCVRGGAHRGIFVIADSTVAPLYGRSVLRDLTHHGLRAIMLDFPAGEQSKSPAVALALQSRLLELKIRRDSLIIALGGGVVGDLAGYVAATILRGVDFIQVPTTVLAQVDSSVGGKVGIDHPQGKNLIGAFHQPKAVVIDPDVLRTLPVAEYRNGLAEIVKIAAALDRDLFRSLERNVPGLSGRDVGVLQRLIGASVRLKAAVVERDERESGLRKALNLGHTVGHAVESAMDYRVRHGEAIAIGLVSEARIAHAMGVLPEKECVRLIGLLTRLKLPTRFPRYLPKKRFLTALSLDKKSEGTETRFVLLSRIGSSMIGMRVPLSLISGLFE